MKSKKGDLSITTIIMVALGLLVLIVLAILIFRSGSNASDSTVCITKGGVCKTGICDNPIGNVGEYCGTGQTCCSPLNNRG